MGCRCALTIPPYPCPLPQGLPGLQPHWLSGRGLGHSAWDVLPPYFPRLIAPTTLTLIIRCWLTRGLPKHTSAATPYLSPQVPTWCYILHLLLVCVSLTCHLTWTVHCRHTSMAGPGKPLNTHLAITLLNRSPAPRSAKNAPTPTTGHSYLPKTYEIRTNHVSGVSVNHSANTSGCGVYVHTRPRTLELQHPHPPLCKSWGCCREKRLPTESFLFFRKS